jgi:hypothetical protein
VQTRDAPSFPLLYSSTRGGASECAASCSPRPPARSARPVRSPGGRPSSVRIRSHLVLASHGQDGDRRPSVDRGLARASVPRPCEDVARPDLRAVGSPPAHRPASHAADHEQPHASGRRRARLRTLTVYSRDRRRDHRVPSAGYRGPAGLLHRSISLLPGKLRSRPGSPLEAGQHGQSRAGHGSQLLIS